MTQGILWGLSLSALAGGSTTIGGVIGVCSFQEIVSGSPQGGSLVFSLPVDSAQAQ
jgi:hypothetical protein